MRRVRALLIACATVGAGVSAAPAAGRIGPPPELAIARLQYDGGGDWYANASSLPNLLAAVRERTTLRPAPVEARVRLDDDRLWDYPYLHMTGHGEVKFSPSEVARLRAYVLRGGFLHADDNYGMDASFRREIARVFPDRPLVEVPRTHPIYHVVYDFPRGLPKIHEHDGKPARGFGIFVGDRLAVFYSVECDLGNGWETRRYVPWRPAGAARAGAAHGREPVRLRRDGAHGMSTGVAAARSGSPLAERVAREHDATVRLARLAAGGAVATGVVVGAAAAVWALGDGRWLTGPATAPALCGFALGVLGLGGAAAAERAVRRGTARDRVVRHVEGERALRSGALRVALEVGEAGAMGALAAAQLAPALAGHAGALAPAWRRRLVRRVAGAGVALAGGAGVLAVSAARWPDGATALAHPVAAARGTLLPPLQFVGAPARVARGRDLHLRLDAPGRRRVEVAWRIAGRGWATRTVVPDDRGRAEFALGTVDAALAVVATDGRARTDTLHVAADDRAFVGAPRLRATYPAYLGLPVAEVPFGDTVRVPRGTVLDLHARASAPSLRVSLVESGTTHTAEHVGDSLVVRWTPAGTARLAWVAAADARGAVDMPEAFVVVAVPDAPPTASAALQQGVYDGATPVIVAISAGDDHGLASVRLHVSRRATGGAETTLGAPVVLLGAGGGTQAAWSGAATVDPVRLGITPGEAAVIRVEAVDASPWAQRGWSTPLVLAAPTRAVLRTSARATGDSAVAGVAAALAAARDLEQRTADAARSRTFAGAAASASPAGAAAPTGTPNAAGPRAATPLSYEAAERARALAAQQRQLASSVATARAQTEALERRLQQAGALDTALARQLADARRMLQDALTPELAAKLAAMEQGGAGMSAPQARATLEELASAQRALRERLERTADLLRRAALEGAMQTLGDEARDVAAAEARAIPPQANGTKAQSGGADAERAKPAPAESPAQTAARAAAVRDAIDSLRARLGREQATSGANGAAQANAHAARSAQAMQQAAAQATRQAAAGRSGAQGEPESGAASAAQSAASEMRAAADALAQGRTAQIDAWKASLGAELDRAASETAQLAREQAAVREAARAGNDPAGARSAEAAVRQGVEQTARRLEQAGRTSALVSERTRRAMDEARQQVGAAARALERQGGGPNATPGGGSPGGASPSSGSASAGRSPDAAMAAAEEALARASGALVRDRARVRDANSATGAEEVLAQFRAAAGQQGQINAQSLALPQPGGSGSQGSGTQGKGGEGKRGQSGQNGEGSPGGGREGARRLAEQQRAIADRLERIGDADASGRSDELAREARALAATLDRQAAGAAPNDPVTLARQQQLYRKLLEAGQSLERDEQDEQGPRQARAGVTVGAGAPGEGVTRGRAATHVTPPTWTELRALPPEERRLVLEYFRRLNASSDGTPGSAPSAPSVSAPPVSAPPVNGAPVSGAPGAPPRRSP